MATDFFTVNGMRVANIKNESPNAFFGIAVIAGSNYEDMCIAGISHFAEHMVFKGTKNRTWKDINRYFARIGADNNAYTSNSEVVYYTTVPKENIEKAIDIMLDMFFNSTFPQYEFDKEKNVIVEEKKMYEDDPYWAFQSEVSKNFFVWEKGHDPIGEFDTINSITRESLMRYFEDKTNKENVVFICSGDIDSDDLKSYLDQHMPNEGHPYIRNGSRNVVSDQYWSDIVEKDVDIHLTVKRDNIMQSQVKLLSRGYSVCSDKYEPSAVIINALGGGSHSRLFERIREELGLCYSIHMNNSAIAYPDYTVTTISGYTSEDNIPRFMEETEDIIEHIKREGLDKDLFECAKTDILSTVLRQTETSKVKASFLTKRYLFTDDRISFEDAILRISNITLDDCNNIMYEMFCSPRYWAVMSPKT